MGSLVGVERTNRRLSREDIAGGGWVVQIAPGGRLHWIAPETVGQSDQAAPDAPERAGTQAAERRSAADAALVEENRRRIEKLRERTYPAPELRDIVADVLSRTHPILALAATGWVLQAAGVLPLPVPDSAVTVLGLVGWSGREWHRRLRTEHVSPDASHSAAWLWGTHPSIAATLFSTVLDRVIDSIKDASAVDDTELEDQLDALLPGRRLADNFFDPRRFPA